MMGKELKNQETGKWKLFNLKNRKKKRVKKKTEDVGLKVKCF